MTGLISVKKEMPNSTSTGFALINIDEFDQISEKDQAFLKHILQKPEVMTRKPYKRSVESMDGTPLL